MFKENAEEPSFEEKVTPDVKRTIVIPTGSMELSSPGGSNNDFPCQMATSCSCEGNKDCSNHSSWYEAFYFFFLLTIKQ